MATGGMMTEVPTEHEATAGPASGAQALDEVLRLRIVAMRALLQSLGPCSDREALALLREAFPDLPLASRIEAFGRWRS